jgi:hypothetical protein
VIDGVIDGVKRSEVGLWFFSGDTPEAHIFQINLDLLPLHSEHTRM